MGRATRSARARQASGKGWPQKRYLKPGRAPGRPAARAASRPGRPPHRPAARGGLGECERDTGHPPGVARGSQPPGQAAPGHPPGVALLYTGGSWRWWRERIVY